MDVSDPRSPNFGKHWTPEQVYDFFSPDPDTINEVEDWLSGIWLLSVRNFAFAVKVPDWLGEELGDVGSLRLQCVPYQVGRDEVGLAPDLGTVDAEKTDD